MDLLHLVDRLEELIASSQKMPIGSRAIVDRRRLLDIADQMRIAIPEEVREAAEMVAERDRLMREADEEARTLVARAEQEAARLVQDDQITEGARRRADEIAVQAEARLQERIAEANSDIQQRLVESRRLAEQQMGAADAYARELFDRLDHQLQAFVRSVQSGIVQLGPAGDDDEDAAAIEREVAAALAAEELPSLDPPSSGLPPLVPSRGSANGGQSDAPLENLLRTPLQPSAERVSVPAAEEGVIDDLDMPSLDDDPARRLPLDETAPKRDAGGA